MSILSVHNLSKKYFKKGSSEPFWALKDVSFEVQPGEIVGVIGRNGAGKSTLLKILGDVIAPTNGHVQFTGRVVSILDIGTGFHPDLTGYENIFFSASLYGLTRKQASEQVETIIEFSGVRDFIHEPLRNYSNGMYLRLAFSTAVHVNAQILLLDEVIAVGDRDFRNKCYWMIRELAAKGVTIILVSHQISQILEFCNRSIWMEKGRINFDGKPIEVAEQYLGTPILEKGVNKTGSSMPMVFPQDFSIENFVHLKSVAINTSQNEILVDQPFDIEIECEKMEEESSLEIAISIFNMDGIRVFTDSYGLRENYLEDPIKNKGNYKLKCTIPQNLLTRGLYTVSLSFCKSMVIQRELEHLISFKIKEGLLTNNDPTANFSKMGTIIRPLLDWTVELK